MHTCSNIQQVTVNSFNIYCTQATSSVWNWLSLGVTNMDILFYIHVIIVRDCG